VVDWGFSYIFGVTLDVHTTKINNEMTNRTETTEKSIINVICHLRIPLIFQYQSVLFLCPALQVVFFQTFLFQPKQSCTKNGNLHYIMCLLHNI